MRGGHYSLATSWRTEARSGVDRERDGYGNGNGVGILLDPLAAPEEIMRLGTFDFLVWMAGFIVWIVLFNGVTTTWGLTGFSVYLGATLAILYLRSPNRKPLVELDDRKVPTPERHDELIRDVISTWDNSKEP